MWGKLGGAGIGLAIGGPLGALAGAFAGHFLMDADGAPFTLVDREFLFTTGLVALSAKMARADGVVTRDEVAAFRRVVEVSDEELPRVQALFDLAKETPHGYEAYARQLAELLASEPVLREDVIDGLFHIAKADGAIHEAEFACLREVSAILGFPGHEFERIAARHVRQADDPYLVLGAERSMSNDELKRLHRRLVAESHPDREIARGLPPEAVKIATERLAAINAAWERIRTERGIA